MKTVLRVVLVVDGLVFLAASVLNMGVQVPLGFTDVSFPAPVFQAGIGEGVIGLALVLAGLAAIAMAGWVAFGLSVVGIAFGLSSPRVVGPARDVHVLLVPLALVVLGLLAWNGRQIRLGVTA